jgi:predicted metal-dependent hydrolase
MPEDAYDPLYLRGIELFNTGRFFSSHEVWEERWLAEGGPSRLFFKGLIQAAVALHHLQRGNAHGARKLLAGSHRYLGPYGPRHRGLDVDAFLAGMTRCVEAGLSAEEGGVRDWEPLVPEIRLDPPPDPRVR